MNQDTTLLIHVRHVLNRQFADFVNHVGLAQEEFHPASVDSTQLAAATRQCLFSLDEFRPWLPDAPTSEIQERLRDCASIAVELGELRFFMHLLNDTPTIEMTGGDLVRQRCRTRIQRYEYKLIRFRQKLAYKRLAAQVERLLAELGYEGKHPEPSFAEFCRETVTTAFRQFVDELDFDEPSIAFFYESSENLQRLRQVLEEFSDASDGDDWGVLINDVRNLERQAGQYVDYGATRMRCTKWLEMSRTAEETQALRALAAIALERGELIYGQLMERWNEGFVVKVQANLERSLGAS